MVNGRLSPALKPHREAVRSARFASPPESAAAKKRAPARGALFEFLPARRIAPEPEPNDYRFENWNDLRALARPYFLRSTTRESRVRNPPFFRTTRRSGSK